jgi:hypothetical protein
MSGDAKAAIAETAARGKQLLFNDDGTRVGFENHVSSFIVQVLLPAVKTIEEAQAGPIFDWGGKTHAYRKDIAAIYIDGVDGDPFIDRVLCGTAAIMLNEFYGIPDPKLRRYVCNRLAGGLAPQTKRGRGKKKTTTDYRDIIIAGRLIAPLLDRFSPTRNQYTKNPAKAESACSITAKALASVGLHMSEKRLENIWAKFSHLYVPAK